MDDLSPCPFCGGEAEFHTDPGPTGECYGWVGCNQCDAMSAHCDIRSMQPEELHPIDAWNARVDADRIEALQSEVAGVREALAHMANTINIVGSDYDQSLQAMDRLVASVKKQALQALKGSTDAE